MMSNWIWWYNLKNSKCYRRSFSVYLCKWDNNDFDSAAKSFQRMNSRRHRLRRWNWCKCQHCLKTQPCWNIRSEFSSLQRTYWSPLTLLSIRRCKHCCHLHRMHVCSCWIAPSKLPRITKSQYSNPIEFRGIFRWKFYNSTILPFRCHKYIAAPQFLQSVAAVVIY